MVETTSMSPGKLAVGLLLFVASSLLAVSRPDPTINGGCSNGGPPCVFTAASASSVNQTDDGWSYVWSVSPGTGVSYQSNTSGTFNPIFTQQGTFTISLTVTNSVGVSSAAPKT